MVTNFDNLLKTLADDNKNEITFVDRDIDLLQSKQLSKALEKNTSLISISLISNNIGDNGVKELAEALKKNKSLTSIKIVNNNITDDGVKALAEALKENKSLIHMPLEPNENIIDTKEITKYIQRNSTMDKVYRNENKDPDSVEMTLLFALNKIKSSCNKIDELSNIFITSMGYNWSKNLSEKNIANIPSKLFPNEEEAKSFANKVIEILNERNITSLSGDEIIETTQNVQKAMNDCLKPKTSIVGKIHAYLTEDEKPKNQDLFLRVD